MVRADISPGYQIVQAAHAVAEHEHHHPGSMAGRTMVVLQVPNELLLKLLFNHIQNHGFWVTMFYEPDIEQHTAFAVSPGEAWKWFEGMKLAG